MKCAEATIIEVMGSTKQFDTVVAGLGKTGFACAKYLAARGINFAVTDDRELPPMLNEMKMALPSVPLYLGGFNESVLLDTEHLLVSPGVSLQETAISRAISAGVEVYGDIELFCRNSSVPVIAITGSNGKSTVTTLVAEMARAATIDVVEGGNLGIPVLELLLDEISGRVPDVYVLELSSFQLETVKSLDAIAAVVLNISPDHLDRYENLNEYIEAKERIYNGSGTIIINLDDPIVVNMSRDRRNLVGFTLSEPEAECYGLREYESVPWIVKGCEKLLPVNDICLKGKHNIANAMAALALLESLDCPLEPILDVLRSFAGLEHRCQWIAEHENVQWINDSKGTNVGAACAAIAGLSGNENLILIAGGDGKGADFSALEDLAQGRLKAAIVLGKDGSGIAKALLKVVPVHSVDTIESAVEMAARMAKAGDIVLLSPACASLDMFKNYQARGEAFVTSIGKVLEGQGDV